MAMTNLSLLALLVHAAGGQRLGSLNIDPAAVATVGLGDAADFAHQFHIAFSQQVSGACIFSGQPFNCAISGFSADSAAWHAEMAALGGAASSANDHCKSNPDVVDVGSLVDYPRRHCGQNPVDVPECFDDVIHVKRARVFLFRGTQDNVSAAGAIENVDGLLAQMVTDPARSLKVVLDQPFGHVLPLPSTPHAGMLTPAGYDGPAECLKHVFDLHSTRSGAAAASNWRTFEQDEFGDERGRVGFQPLGWVYVPNRCEDLNGEGAGANPCMLVLRPGRCSPPDAPVGDELAAWADRAERLNSVHCATVPPGAESESEG